MTDDVDRQLEVASLLSGRYYLILNNNDLDSFSMSAYDTNVRDKSNEIPAGMIILSGLIELMENNFETIWDAGVARTKFLAAVENIQVELDDDEVDEAVDKVLSKTGNIIKVDFGKKQ